ncbi:MAG TPA: DUF4912 domain-containing protein, partial [Candidatus Limnocylindria bacterium]|nr:DUF4912 domain-containing protein [Candidatus Limnocylindria bacterium]
MKTPSKPGSPASGSGPKPASRTAPPVAPTDAKPVEPKPPVPAPVSPAKAPASGPVPAPATKAKRPVRIPVSTAKTPPPVPVPAPADKTNTPVSVPVSAAKAPPVPAPATASKVRLTKAAATPAKAKSVPPPAAAVEAPAVPSPAASTPPPTKALKKVGVPTIALPKTTKPKPSEAVTKVTVAAPLPKVPSLAEPVAEPKMKTPRRVAAVKKPAARRQRIVPPAVPPVVPLPTIEASDLPAESPITPALPASPPSVLFSSSAAPSVSLPPIPPILLEGDHPVKLPTPASKSTAATPGAPAKSRPDHSPGASGAALASSGPMGSPAGSHVPGEPAFAAPFPDSGSLWLVARDPFNLCAHWNLDPSALDAYAAEHRGAWRLRVWVEMPGAWLAGDQPLPMGVTHRFVPVVMPATRYVAEIGFLAADGSWQGLAVSQPVATPADAVSMDTGVTMATVAPAPVTPDMLWLSPPDAAPVPRATIPLLSLPDLAKAAQLTALVWKALAASGVGNSGEITELVGEHVRLPGGASLGPTAGGPELPVGVGEALPSSESVPTPPLAAPRGFWFKVNAEVILYGSTERDAQVTI